MPAANAMVFDVTCEKCGAVYHASEQHIGGYIKCMSSGCDGRVPIDRNNSSALEYAFSEQTAAPQPAPATARRNILSEWVLRALRLVSASFLFVVLALLLSKLFLVAGGYWLTLSRRGLLLANINAGILIALGFACASWLVVFWGAYGSIVTNHVIKRLCSAWTFTVERMGAIRKMRLRWKVTCGLAICVVATASFWFYPRQSRPPDFSDLDSFLRERAQSEMGAATPDNSGSVSKSLPNTQPELPEGYTFVEDVTASQTARRHSGPTQVPAAADERPTAYNTRPTGTRITSDLGTDGHGKLNVSNGTGVDAVVRLYDASTDQTIRWFWVQSGGSAQIGEIPQGTYTLAYTAGLDWLESEDAFRWHPSYSEFGKLLRYTEERDSEGIQYRNISVTLHPVAGGNVRTKAISREQFLKGHHHTVLQK